MKPRTYETDFTLDLGVLGERTCFVTFKYSPGHPGSWYRRNGDPGDPPEPPELEVVRVTCLDCDITEMAADYLIDSDPFMDRAYEAYEASNSPEEV